MTGGSRPWAFSATPVVKTAKIREILLKKKFNKSSINDVLCKINSLKTDFWKSKMWKLCLLYICNTYNSYFGEPWEGGRRGGSKPSPAIPKDLQTSISIYLQIYLSIYITFYLSILLLQGGRRGEQKRFNFGLDTGQLL